MFGISMSSTAINHPLLGINYNKVHIPLVGIKIRLDYKIPSRISSIGYRLIQIDSIQVWRMDEEYGHRTTQTRLSTLHVLPGSQSAHRRRSPCIVQTEVHPRSVPYSM
jgi:hypothetical protein